MDEMEYCEICGEKHLIIDNPNYSKSYKCSEYPSVIHESVFYNIDGTTRERRLNAIYNYLYKKPFYDNNSQYWRFFYEETDEMPKNDMDVNVYHLMKTYPTTIIEKIDAILLNMAKLYPSMSSCFGIYDWEKYKRLFYCDSTFLSNDNLFNEEFVLLHILIDQKYIASMSNQEKGLSVDRQMYAISYEGWQRIDELRKSIIDNKNVFIAMSFNPDLKYIEDNFKKAIIAEGFSPQIIKDKEHNNYIMPEIFYEINKCWAVVVDITEPNNGAYYEAGYAQALGKEVIVCCKKDIFNNKDTKPHFDIAQKSMILWETEDDLVERLRRRLKATYIK